MSSSSKYAVALVALLILLLGCLVPQAAHAQASLSIAPASAEVKPGEAVQLRAFVVGEGLNGPEVTEAAEWSVGDAGVASVVYGLVTGLSPGRTVVRATYEGLTGSAEVTVTADSGGQNENEPTTCRVGVAVVGRDGKLLFGPGYVWLSEADQWGLTPLGALDLHFADHGTICLRANPVLMQIRDYANETS